jgi:hypothetical protein
MTRRGRILSYGSAALLVVVGVVVAVVIGSMVAAVIGLLLSGVGLVLATSLVFYEVGLSEDRERAREQAARQAKAREAGSQGAEAQESGTHESGTDDHALQRRRRAHLSRARGQHRRLN